MTLGSRRQNAYSSRVRLPLHASYSSACLLQTLVRSLLINDPMAAVVSLVGSSWRNTPGDRGTRSHSAHQALQWHSHKGSAQAEPLAGDRRRISPSHSRVLVASSGDRNSMSLDLHSVLDLPSSLDRRRLLVLTSDELNNSSFLLHTLIQCRAKSLRSACMRAPAAAATASPGDPGPASGSSHSPALVAPSLVMLCLNQSFAHYSAVAAKSFGLNLKVLREAGLIRVVDVLRDWDSFVADDGWTLDMFKMESAFLQVMRDAAAAPSSSSRCLVMVDDVRVLLSQGVCEARVLQWLLLVRSLASRANACLVLQSHWDPEEERSVRLSHEDSVWRGSGEPDDGDEDPDDGETDAGLRKLLAALISAADVWIDAQGLRTGFSATIDGSLVVREYDHEQQARAGVKRSRYHFKTMDRNTRLMAVGTA